MWFLIIIVALMIPTVGILVDSPIGRALARRLEPGDREPADLSALTRKVELLESEVDDLGRSVEQLREENQFLQRLIENQPGPRPRISPGGTP